MNQKSRLAVALPAVPIESIERRIYLVRGHKVMIDSDLADLYRVTTGNLNLAVRRNKSRFPEEFMFQLTKEEARILFLQIARAKVGSGGRRTPPYAFTEHGVAMLSSVLKSERAVQMNILIIRAFVHLREILAAHQDLAAHIEKIEAEQSHHASVIKLLAEDIETLKRLRRASRRRAIGFRAKL